MAQHTGFHHTEETKRKLSEMRRGDKNPFWGRKHNAGTIERIRKWNLNQDPKTGKITIHPSTVKIPDETRIAYIAGIIDGDGSITRRGKAPLILVYNTDRILIDWLLENVGGRIGSVDHRGRVPCYAWELGAARNVYRLVKAIRPFLLVKDEIADKTIDQLEEKYGNRING